MTMSEALERAKSGKRGRTCQGDGSVKERDGHSNEHEREDYEMREDETMKEDSEVRRDDEIMRDTGMERVDTMKEDIDKIQIRGLDEMKEDEMVSGENLAMRLSTQQPPPELPDAPAPGRSRASDP